jgi:hypothetical protein
VQIYRHLQSKGWWQAVKQQFGGLSTVLRWSLVIGLILSSGLFVERYGLNLAHYHKPVPDCAQVLSVEQCSAYGPWIRDYSLAQSHPKELGSPLEFTHQWLYGLWQRSFFAVDGPSTEFQTRRPLPLPGITVIIAAVVGAPVLVWALPRLLRRYDKQVLWLFLSVITIYLVTLWFDGYEAFSRTGRPVAINGRYLFPVLLPVLLLIGLAYQELLRRWDWLKAGVGLVIILGFLWGGGALTYILRSNDAWHWPSPVVRAANHGVQRILGPLTPGYVPPSN